MRENIENYIIQIYSIFSRCKCVKQKKNGNLLKMLIHSLGTHISFLKLGITRNANYAKRNNQLFILHIFFVLSIQLNYRYFFFSMYVLEIESFLSVSLTIATFALIILRAKITDFPHFIPFFSVFFYCCRCCCFMVSFFLCYNIFQCFVAQVPNHSFALYLLVAIQFL